jgi:hypothetical protein
MTLSALVRWSGLAALVGAVLLAIGDLMHFAAGFGSYSQQATTASFVIHSLLLLLGGVLILLELVGLYANQAEVTGPVGLVSFLVAFLGTALVVGVTWNELFVASYMAVVAPRVLDAAPTGSLALGFSLSFGIFALGWLLFGLDTLRAGVYPRAAAILLIIGAVVFISHLYPPLGSCLARPWLGWASHYSLERSDQYDSPASKLG